MIASSSGAPAVTAVTGGSGGTYLRCACVMPVPLRRVASTLLLCGGAAALFALARADYRTATRGALAFLVCASAYSLLSDARAP